MVEQADKLDPAEETNADDLYEHYRFTADPGQSLLRIDKFLNGKIQNVSRNRIQNAARNHCILVNEKAVKNNYKVKPGDVVSVVLPHPPRDTTVYPENIPIDIVYEDNHLLIINKEAGMVVHPAYGNFTGTLVNALVYHFDNLPGGEEAGLRPGLVHRIDKDTSGLLVIAKSEAALTHLARQFYEHSIERTYQAVVWGLPKQDEGSIESYLGRDPRDRKKMHSFNHDTEGKHAVTHYRVLEKFAYTSLVECRLETGRTHQIRVHMKSIGHPLFADEKYGGSEVIYGPVFSKYKQFVKNCFALCPRQALHAKTLGFVHPQSNKQVRFTSELPQDMLLLIEKLRKYQ